MGENSAGTTRKEKPNKRLTCKQATNKIDQSRNIYSCVVSGILCNGAEYFSLKKFYIM